uniref:Peptidase M28 domain-containing protein n=1 Tax=viral metagenome TaxID=1070528 RepID=A0A6C0HUT7_9ZZZZ
MIILLIIIIVVLIMILFYLNTTKETFKETLNNSLDLDNIKRITKEVSINRPVGSTNLLNVKKFVINELNKLGLDVEEQKFTKKIKGKNYDFSNIIAKNKNVNDNYIILGCHIDGPQIDIMEAATDAASCVGLIIEITKKLLINKTYPLMIVFFDGEEAIDGSWDSDNTLSGSTYFVNNFNKNIKFLMIFDLIGGDIDKNKIYHFKTNSSNKNYMKQLSDINNSLNYKYPKQIFVNPDTKISDIGVINDYTPFINKYPNLAGLNLIPSTFPDNHHTINDNYNNLNWEYIEIFSNVVYEFLLKLKID